MTLCSLVPQFVAFTLHKLKSKWIFWKAAGSCPWYFLESQASNGSSCNKKCPIEDYWSCPWGWQLRAKCPQADTAAAYRVFEIRRLRTAILERKPVVVVLVAAVEEVVVKEVQRVLIFLTQSELIEPVSPQAAQLGIHFIIFLSQHTVRGSNPGVFFPRHHLAW